MTNFKFTVFTPCYNGEKTVERVFKSVANQTYTNFEWIIVNDGSKDNSGKRIAELRQQYPQIDSKIIYLEQENLGKHMAWNRGVELATGDLWLSADCDDSFLPNTLEYFNEKVNSLPDVAGGGDLRNSRFSGVNVCVFDPKTGEMIGSPYPQDGMESDNVELQYRYHIQGEHWGIVRTDLLRKYKFPIVKGHFYTENRIWFSFARDGYKVMCFNDCLRAYFYEATSLTNNAGYRFDYNTSLMYLQNSIWVLKNLGRRILDCSSIEYLRLYLIIAKGFVKIGLCKFFGK